MERTTFDILIVGPQGQFREIFDHLETQENYRIHYATDYQNAFGYLSDHVPGAIILNIQADERSFAEEMEWLDIMKTDAPVLVLSPLYYPHLYKTAIQRGAFDFFTAYTPPDEFDRELNNAITQQTCAVA